MKRIQGFTLIELAVAVFVIALLLGSLLVPLTTQVEQKQISDTQKALEEIKEALVGFALANGYLPCPDTDNDGLENWNSPGNGRCSSIVGGISVGNLPWATLGVASADVWGNRFRYIINERYARHASTELFSIGVGGTDVRICTTQACGTTLSTTAAAAILSLGKNGYGATNSLSGTTNPAPTSADELENTDTDRNVVSRVQSGVGSTAGEFDDIVTWLSEFLLFNRMVSAGKLP